mmetsp:Transcript_2773/g.6071  ORF Transcript_2773/g.6071 Transcript_2773/m.6071 type:complete len:150 (-) Transcript_2773:194-643(-)
MCAEIAPQMERRRVGFRLLGAMLFSIMLPSCRWVASSSPTEAFACARAPSLLHRADRSRLLRRGVDDTETMSHLFTKYYRLQEANERLEGDTKVKVVAEFLEVLDDLERAEAQYEADEEAAARAVRVFIGKMESKLKWLGFSRIEELEE